jgi:hypothetical protein
MKTKTSPLKKAGASFCLVAIALLSVTFGSYYLTWCGPNYVPFSDWSNHRLWLVFILDGCEAAFGAFAVAAAVFYIISRRMQDDKSKAAA